MKRNPLRTKLREFLVQEGYKPNTVSHIVSSKNPRMTARDSIKRKALQKLKIPLTAWHNDDWEYGMPNIGLWLDAQFEKAQKNATPKPNN